MAVPSPPMGSRLLTQEQKLKALCDLSDLSSAVDVQQLMQFVREAPDPDTATRELLNRLPLESEVLHRKWRDTITDLWSSHHPDVPLLPALPLTSHDVQDVPSLKDTHAYLACLAERPARLVRQGGEWLLEPTEVARFLSRLPSYRHESTLPVESEWAYQPLRRLRAVLQTLRLMRAVKGELALVPSRAERFQRYPLKQQWYALWHADAYHVDWDQFAGLWGDFMGVIQGYLPLLWEINEDIAPHRYYNPAVWCLGVIEAFIPLWEEEGILHVGKGRRAIMPILKQHALPSIIIRFLLRDLLERHGLVAIHEGVGIAPQFTWTTIGQTAIPAEAAQELPCGLDLLKRRAVHYRARSR